MRAIRDTYAHDHGGKPVISICDIGDCIVGKIDATGDIVAYRYGPHAVSSMRKYLKREFNQHTIRG